MEKASKRGKIPQSDWPLIMARYEAGETLASIARTYDCSPPAISYVVSRSRARHTGAATQPKPPTASEPQLIKAAAGEHGTAAPGHAAAANGHAAAANGHAVPRANSFADTESKPSAPQPQAPVADRSRAPEVNGFGRSEPAERHASPGMGLRPAAPQRPVPPPPHTNGTDQRRTLHLSLGNPGANGNPHPPELHSDRGPSPEPHPAHGRDDQPRTAGFSEIRPAFDEPARRSETANPQRKDNGGPFIDQELRARVDGDIAVFLAAFDAALLQDTQESRSALREATDRLLRAGARTRIELERLEARMPLPPRNTEAGSEPAWRHR